MMAGYSSPLPAFPGPSPHTPSSEDDLYTRVQISTPPNQQEHTQIHPRPMPILQPIYSHPVPKQERGKRQVTPRERRRARNRVNPMGASTESPPSSSSGDLEDGGSRMDFEQESSAPSLLQQELRSQILQGGGLKAGGWPRTSIPRRVNKLSLEKERDNLRLNDHFGEQHF